MDKKLYKEIDKKIPALTRPENGDYVGEWLLFYTLTSGKIEKVPEADFSFTNNKSRYCRKIGMMNIYF
ncbi:hypothetical protein [Neobacillus niacini]|uniref:hypothetical protein n=1 Tax=Neobacillus niacini TaxID=86668 RepID=UPI0039833C5A